MKKKTILSIVFSLTVLSSLFADSYTMMKFLIMRYVDENVMNYVFQDAAGNNYADSSEIAIDPYLDYEDEESADYTQIVLAGSTNWTKPYYLFLTFSPMLEYDTAGANKFLYKARVTTGNNKTLVQFNPSTKADVTINFRGVNSADPDIVRTDIAYPIEFSFKDYITSYSGGKYVATITLEIEPI